MTAILGISAFYHDSAAALLIDGEIIAAAQEERFSRKKHDAGYPFEAIEYVLKEGGLLFSDLSHIVYYDKPFLKFERLLETYLSFSPRGFSSFKLAIPIWIKEKLFLKNQLLKQFKRHEPKFDDLEKILFSEHHFSHAASAFYPSPYDEAVVLTLDGVGEWATSTVAIGKGHNLSIKKELHFPHSLGLLYSAFTYYTGFKVNSGEYKVMGLAPYGKPRFKDLMFKHLIDLKPDGSFRLDQSYFCYAYGLTMTNKKFDKLFGASARKSEKEPLKQFHMDMAASVQAATEDIVLTMTKHLAEKYNINNLCLAGGVALNCVANGKLKKQGAFENIWIQPAAGDAGGALGAALGCWHQELDHPRKPVTSSDQMRGSYLGPQFSQKEIEKELQDCGAAFKTLSEETMLKQTVEELEKGSAIGWFQGRMEFGPRALGARSIIGDPRSKTMQKVLNLKVKFRESFRPFAPSVLKDDVNKMFDYEGESPYMLMVANIKQSLKIEMTEEEEQLFGIDKLNIVRSKIPAITHVDYSARIQTVDSKTNPKYYALIEGFKKATGYGVVINTSFNIRGEPIVGSPTDAYKCFMGTGLDFLVIGNSILHKSQQPQELIEDYKNQFELD